MAKSQRELWLLDLGGDYTNGKMNICMQFCLSNLVLKMPQQSNIRLFHLEMLLQNL